MHAVKTLGSGFRQLTREERRQSLLDLATIGMLLAGQFALVLWLFLR
jgi:hypothetical protein